MAYALLLMKFEQEGTKMGMMKSTKYFSQIPWGLDWRRRNKPKSTILGDFWGIYEIFKGGKGTPDHQSKKIPSQHFTSSTVQTTFSY
jgi:hypothetical protein